MKIENSNIMMKSEHSSYTHTESSSLSVIMRADEAATLEFSDESKSLVEQMKERQQEQKRRTREQVQERNKKNADNFAMAVAEAEKSKNKEFPTVRSEEDVQIETLKKILEMLKRMQNRRLGLKDTVPVADKPEQRISEKKTSAPASIAFSDMVNLNGGKVIAISSGAGGAVRPTWKQVVVTSSFRTELEYTAFQSQGCVKTQDGREISFNVEVEMSRAFCEKYDSIFVQDVPQVCDPLVFHLEGNIGTISDQKFLFDLNADGTEEEISFTGQGSGFLALDKNKDGEINDGSELFGTKSGDGFKDLAQYDEDGNGWIDENDSVFEDLSIWTLNEEGEKVQISLLKADVGAIYLGNASTEFSLKNEETHDTNGIIRSTGIYLKESGGAGTVQHIDLVI